MRAAIMDNRIQNIVDVHIQNRPGGQNRLQQPGNMCMRDSKGDRKGRGLPTACVRWRAGWGIAFLLISAAAIGQEAGPQAGAAAATGVPTADTGAQAFTKSCAGCHTIGAGALSGPDLKATASWPRQNLFDAVKRMEKNVGPMSDDLVNGLTDFLLSPDAADRLKAEQQRVALAQAAKLDPASAATGERLFHGVQPFSNGGLACAACHQAGSAGGNLAISLEDAFSRLGEAPLLSTCENPGFPLMRAAYANRPLIKQEAVHLVKYLESVSQKTTPAKTFPLHGIGMAGALVLFAGLGHLQRGRLLGVRARLVSGALRRRQREAAGRRERQ